MSDLPPSYGGGMNGRSRYDLFPALGLLLMAAACGDPLPPDAQWLAGRWRWLGSCCTIAGTGPVPSSPEAFVIDLHHNGDVEVYEDGVETVHTRFDVDIIGRDTLVRFEKSIFHAAQFAIERTASDRLALQEFPRRCVDCPNRHAFARAP